MSLVLLVLLCMSWGGAGAATGTRLKIPKLGINAGVVKVGLTDTSELAVGGSTSAVYTWRRGDPPCDPMGTTVYAGHAWRSGNGVADNWGKLKRGDVIKVAGCRFRVTKKRYRSGTASISHLYRVDGPPRIALVGCKADDYSKRVIVIAKMLK